MHTLLIATRNAHKVGEIRAILGEQFRYLSLKDFSAAPNVIEDANSFAGNATKKSVQLSTWLSETQDFSRNILVEKFFVLADDSGLEVDALGGAPGIYSARFAAMDSGTEGNSSDAANNQKLLRLLESVPAKMRTARFRCAIALTPLITTPAAANSPVCFAEEAELRTEIFEGACEGRIEFAPSGQGGFGYDSLFTPDGFKKSFLEIGDAEKNKISHRAKALAKLKLRMSRAF